MKTVQVTNKSIWAEPITVRFLETVDENQQEVYFCNHAQAELIEQENETNTPNGRDIVWRSSVWVCDHCGAYRFEGLNDWQNAPVGGFHG